MKSLLISPKKTSYKNSVKELTARNGTRMNGTHGIRNKSFINCFKYMQYFSNTGFKTRNKLVSKRDKFSLWQK
ncbi:hypothetical protein [Sporocytophaga myxococcoides]|uniref:hypothetical protein n=1 Tax=Sporocytophaga myxococcoides TaxID=153721 RepID=UPI0004175625|nr:hypothetical protein [Sporocytophaga myxococcoides]